MRRGGEMQVNVAGLRRNLKNLAHNYSDAQRKVREATSNDPWGPSSTIMAEISDLTYNVMAFSEIMQMIWKRLNDHGRNWRHVYKALVLLEYLIKTGSEKVGQQCKENIFAIQTLQDFQHLEEGKDQGQNVREKARQLAQLLQDDERLRTERAKAIKAKERLAKQPCAFGSDGGLDTPTSPKYPPFRGAEWNNSRDSGSELPNDLEMARPQTAGEEDLQLQLAIAMSKEEAEQEEQKRRSDDVRLQLALSQSQQDFKTTQDKPSAMLDLLDVSPDEAAGNKNVDPWGMPQIPKPQLGFGSIFLDHPFNMSTQWNTSSPWHTNTAASPPAATSDPWAPALASGGAAAMPMPAVAPMPADPWSPKAISTPLVETAIRNDPWSPVSQSSSDLDDFDAITNRNRTISPTSDVTHNNGTTTNNNSDPFELNLLGDSLPITSAGPSPSTGATKKTPQSFLGENSALVNLDNLVTSTGKPANQMNTANPFSETTQPPRPVFNPQPPKPTMNQIKQAPFMAAPQLGSTPPYASNFNNQSPAFGNSTAPYPTNGAFHAVPQPTPAVDPWTPVPSSNSTASASQLGAPWMKPGYTF
ncbi:epsin-2 isoform X3 [Atheta coriaria]|uniref:epsin-2 isoform X3 n=1 Tax=Dalotia coriaria TaxID=877792 RepID=UPI0031F42324